MPDLADLYPGFAERRIDTSAGEIFARTGGNGPPLLLLHGYTQTHVMWHRVAPALAEHFSLVIPDLPGYGWSAHPLPTPRTRPMPSAPWPRPWSRSWQHARPQRFRLAGHDRGGRVAYRLALDHAGQVERLATLDIVPTYDMWHGMDRNMAMKVWHWPFLAQPEPLPEMLIGKAPVEYLEWKMASWTKAKNLSAFDPRALDHYRAAFSDPRRIHAHCEDYRAGQAADFANDEADREAGKTIQPVRCWRYGAPPAFPMRPAGRSRSGSNGRRRRPAQPIDSGHFLTEENPDATAAGAARFLQSVRQENMRCIPCCGFMRTCCQRRDRRIPAAAAAALYFVVHGGASIGGKARRRRGLAGRGRDSLRPGPEGVTCWRWELRMATHGSRRLPRPA